MRPIPRILTAPVLVLLAACGDDGTGTSGDALTQVEVAALMSTLGGSTAELDITDVPVDGSGRFSLETACPQGGRITSAGQVTERTQTRMVFDLSVEYQDCQQPSNAGVFKIDGGFREAGNFQFGQSLDSFSFEMSLAGDFDWWLGDRSGSCEIDVEFAFAQEDYSITGMICGEPAASLN
jgi:hypothetical protein